MIGETLAHYRITAKLGEGGMGEVWRAKDSKLGREVAIKLLPAHLTADPRALDRFQREARVLASLDHTNIVTVHSIEEEQGKQFLTMNLVEGRSLDERIPAGGLPIDELLEIAVQITDALAAAHERGVIHRDVKPSNVMVGDDGRVKVLDFGLAKLCADDPSCDETQLATQMMTQEGALLGTVAYMSPEQAQGRELDGRSDLFSLGIVLYQMATGRHPFAADNTVATLSSIVKETPSAVTELRSELPSGLAQIIERSLRKEPEKRFQSARELWEALRDLRRESESGGTTPGSSEARVGLPLRWTLVAAAVVVVAAVLSVGLDLGPSGDGMTPREERPLAPADDGRSIAVLPFENLSPDPENAYFSLGMTEELVGKLSRIRGARVRSTPLKWTREDHSTERIGRELGVGYLLEGSVRKAGAAVRVSARLVDVSSGFHLWSEEFDGVLEDVFGMQEATALQIAEALQIELSTEEGAELADQLTDNVEAYDAYLRGWALIESFHIHQERAEERLTAARQHFLRALELDSEYARAMAGLAGVESYTYYLAIDTDVAHLDRGEELAERALELSPDLPEALSVLGHLAWSRGDFETMEKWLRRAVEVDSDNGYAWCGLAAACNLQTPSRPDFAERAARRAIRYQPGYTWSHGQLGLALMEQGRHEEAAGAFEHAVELDPEFQFGHLHLGNSYEVLADYGSALKSYETAFALLESPDLQVDIAAMQAAQGNRGAALESLAAAIASGYDDIDRLTSDRHFAALRRQERFGELLAMIAADS